MRAIITGGAGFIGSSMADFLLGKGWSVTAVDDFSAGHKRFIRHNLGNPRYRLIEHDLKQQRGLAAHFEGHDIVFHFAANADVKGGKDNPVVDLHEGCIVTSNVLEAARANGIKRFVYSSTGSVYGEATVFPTPEDAPFPIQTSMYAASKLYGEGLISAYCEAYDMRAWIFRFVSILGERYTHGVVFSFYKQLREHPDRLEFLSDGTPSKSYLYVGDCIEGMWTAIRNANEKVNVLNLGNAEEISVKEIADIVTARLGHNDVEYVYGEDAHGWIGDNPRISLDIARMRGLGWQPKLPIRDAIVRTLDYFEENDWVLEERYFRK